MVEGIAERAKARQARLLGTIQRLEDDELRHRVQKSYRDNQRTIEEWHDFVEGLDLAMRAMRECRNGAAR
jgi:hypothetical protein